MSTRPSPLPRFHAPTWYRDALPDDPVGAPLSGDFEASTAVVGGGLAGLSTALELCERGESGVLVLDRGDCGEGASGRNGGFVFAGFSLEPEALARRVGAESARRLHGWTRESVATVRRRCVDWGVPVSRGPVLLADWFGDDRRLHAFRERMADLLDFELQWLDRDAMQAHVRSERYGAGLLEPGSFHFNPLAYARAVASHVAANGGRIATGSPVITLEREGSGWRIGTPGATVRCRRVVLATGGYDRRLDPRWQRSVQPIGTYVVVTEPLGERLADCLPADVAVYDTRFAFDYYRSLRDGRLLWGGRISTADRDPAAVERLMRKDLARVFPQLADARIDYAWGGWMSYPRHQMPILGEVEPGLWLALGFGGHGMAPTALAGRVLAEAMTGDDSSLREFSGFGPAWAGGALGRLAVQGVYWWKQWRDRLRETTR